MVDEVWTNIEDVIIKTLLVIEQKITRSTQQSSIPTQNHNSDSCFELFGFDILLDDHFHVWLMEVNFAPSLTADSPLDQQVKGTVLTDMLNLLGLRKANQTNLKKSTEYGAVASDERNPATNNDDRSKSRSGLSKQSSNLSAVASSASSKNDLLWKFRPLPSTIPAAAEDTNMTTTNDDLEIKIRQRLCYAIDTIMRDEVASTVTSSNSSRSINGVSETKMLSEFVAERIRAATTGFKLIIPSPGSCKQYYRFFDEFKPCNALLSRFEFFLQQYEERLQQQLLVVPEASDKKDEIMQPYLTRELWQLFHNRWAKAAGISTSHR